MLRRAASIACWTATATVAAFAVFVAATPPPDLARLHDTSSLVTDRDGRLLRAFTAADGRWRMDLSEGATADDYRRFLIAIEDRRFESHAGVDPRALVRAAVQAARAGRVVSGGSTLAMQVAKLLEPRPRSIAAKLVEMLQAWRLTAVLGRRGVLDAYAVLAPYGGNLEGLRAAGLAWFGKEPGALDPAETALLVALPQAPERLRPDKFPQAARAARNRVLERLEKAGILDPADARAARSADVPRRRLDLPFLAPHAAAWLQQGRPTGSVVRSTLDLTLQTGLERTLRRSIAELPAPIDAAAIVVDRRSGDVLAYAGSSDWAARGRSGMIDHGRALRSPGSTLKPLVYARAFDQGLLHPGTLLRDAPTRFADYAPENFDRGFTGDVPAREALQLSLNLPAVAVLDRIGPVGFVRAMAGAGIALRTGAGTDDLPGLPIVLGGVGTTLLDLASAYAALAGDGAVRPLRWIRDEPEGAALPLVGRDAAAAVRAILADAPRPAGQAASRRALAFKTGTSHRFKDGWAVGFDGAHVAAVWIGRADGGSCRPCSGLGGAAPLLFRTMALLPEAPLEAGPPPTSALAARTPPSALQRLGPVVVATSTARPLVLRFPPDGARIELGTAGASVPLQAQGGTSPYVWLVDGRPLATQVRRGTTPWRPDGRGWSEITLLDSSGRSVAVRVRVE